MVERVRILARVGERLVGMLPGAGRAEYRFGYEGGQQTSTLRHRLDRVLEGHEMVGAFHGVAEREVELVLPGRHLVVARLDGDPQVVEGADDLLANVAGDIDRVVEVAGPVVAPGAHSAARRVGVQE